jgi:hypothetical protein
MIFHPVVDGAVAPVTYAFHSPLFETYLLLNWPTARTEAIRGEDRSEAEGGFTVTSSTTPPGTLSQPSDQINPSTTFRCFRHRNRVRPALIDDGGL